MPTPLLPRCAVWRRPGTPLLPHFVALASPLNAAETRGGVYLRHHTEERKNGRPLRPDDAAQKREERCICFDAAREKEREGLQRRRGISASVTGE